MADGAPDLARSLALEALAQADNQPLARIGALRFLGELATAAGDHLAANSQLMAARDLAITCEAPLDQALTMLALAELRADQGDVTEAKTILADVQRQCDALKATPTLERASAFAARITASSSTAPLPAGLTQRELDVLRLLAKRQTDKEIAETLFLGHRTIQTHVTHILNKLGVANRREAARVAERLGLIE